MTAPVAAPKEYDKRNEFAFRDRIEGELAQAYRKDANVIIPYGMLLGFNGASGQQVIFGLDASDVFSIKVDNDPVVEIATGTDVNAVLSLLANSIALTVDVNGRAASFKLLSDGTTSDIEFKATAFKFFDGLTDRALLSAGGGILTVNGDVAVGGSIAVGAARLKVALETLEFSQVDGDTIQWASGVSIGTAPKWTVDVSALNPLASGEQYDVRLTSVTNIGATVYAKILTPGSTAAQSETTDAAGGVGDPDRVMEKPTSDDAYNGIYSFTVSGTISVTSTYEGEIGQYINTGSVEISTWFDDGGGWDEGPTISIDAYEIVGFLTGSDQTGSHAFEVMRSIEWSQAVGNAGASGYEFGASLESGGTLTDLDQVSYTTQSSSGTRTASPNGEKVKITAFPRNAS